MNNGTDQATPAQEKAIEEIFSMRPDGMPVDEWAAIVRDTLHFVTELTQRLMTACDRHTWCTLTGSPDEHAEGCAGAAVELADANWRGQPVCDVDGAPQLLIDGGAHNDGWFIDAEHVAVVLAATATPEGRAAALALLARVGHPVLS